MPTFLREFPKKTVFEGEVLEIKEDWGVHYEVQNGGWNWQGPDAPDTWLSEHVLARFKGKIVRVTIEELEKPGDSERDTWFALWGEDRSPAQAISEPTEEQMACLLREHGE
jgi:hypothetical protein